MNTKYLEEFVTFAQVLNYSMASKELFISRPTLREHIGEIEKEIGVTLVTAINNQAMLTPAGRKFRGTALKVIESWSKICTDYQNLDERLFAFRVGSSTLNIIENGIRETRTKMTAMYPNTEFDVITVPNVRISLDPLTEDIVDFAILSSKLFSEGFAAPETGKDVDTFPLQIEEISLLVGPNSSLFSREHVQTTDIDGMNFLLPPDLYKAWQKDNMVEHFHKHNARISLSTEPFNDYNEYFANDLANNICIVPSTLIPRHGLDSRNDIHLFTLEDYRLRTLFHLAYKKELLNNKLAASFLATLESFYKQQKNHL